MSAAARFAHIITQTQELVRHLPHTLSYTAPPDPFQMRLKHSNQPTLDRQEKVHSDPRSAPEVNSLEGDVPLLSATFFVFVKDPIFLVSPAIF